MVDFHFGLSERSVYYRYFSFIKLGERVAHERLTRICFNDYDREIALVADCKNPVTGKQEILGVGRLSKSHGWNEGEFALLVSDRWQNRGLGTELLRRLTQVAKNEKLTRLVGHIMPENREMQHLCKKLGFTLKPKDKNGELEAELLF